MKRRFTSYRILIILILISQASFGQFDISTQVQRPSVEASKLTQNIEVPVNLYTGTINIEIPIYTIKYNDITYPIYLSYHGGGIKVADECGAVGLGWTLNATGVVNRIVRGFPDEMGLDNKIGYNNLNSNHRNYIDLIKRHSHKVKDPLIYDSPYLEEIVVCDQTRQYGPDYDEGKLDFAQDNYMFYVHGKSGAFINNGFQKIVQSNDGCEIQNDLLSYTIKSQDGYKYFFGEEERKNYKYRNFYIWENYEDAKNNRSEEDYIHTTSWWLSKLYSPMGDSVTFDYIDAEVRRSTSNTYIYSHLTSAEYYGKDRVFALFDGFSKLDTTYHKLISKIETPNCRILFYYERFRSVSKYPKLDSIVIYSRCADLAIEKFIFTYSGSGEKAKLIKLQRVAFDGGEENYIFSYRQDDISPVITTTDKRVDHWGYFASQSTGRFSHLPYIKAPEFNLSLDESIYTSRNAEHQYADNNMLTSIVYPTGRKMQLVWEPHSFSCLSNLGRNAKSEINYNRPNPEYETILTQKKSFTLCGKNGYETLNYSAVVNAGDVIVVDLTQYYNYIKIWASHLSGCVYNYDNCDIDFYPLPRIVIRKGDIVKQEIIICEETTREPIEIEISETGTYNFELQNPRETISSSTAECGYYLDIFNMSPPDESPDGYVHISVNGTKIQQKDNSDLNVGGVRIKEISHYEGNQCLYKKRYEYVKDDSLKISSGVLAYPHRYGSINKYGDKMFFEESFTGLDYIIYFRELLTLHSIGLPYTLGDNTHIEYSRVVESIIGKNNKKINKVVYNFVTAADYDCEDLNLNSAWEFFIPSNMIQLTSRKHRRGHLKSKIEYTDEILTTTYNYDIKEKANADTITGALYTIADFTDIGLKYSYQTAVPYKNVGIIQYQVIPYNKRIVNITQEGDITNSQVKYYYENTEYSNYLNANQPTIIETINSDNTITRQYISYLGQTNKVLSCITTKEDKVIDAYRYEYDEKQRVVKKYIALLENKNLPIKENCEISTLAESYVYCNNRLVEKTDHLHNLSTVYLWSYNSSYIIAQIQYSTFDEVKNTLGISNVNNLMNADIPDMSIVDDLRSQLPDSYIATFTYKPLIGINSYTDERGQTTYYDYDGFGRMVEGYIIENNQKKVLKHFRYKTTQ